MITAPEPGYNSWQSIETADSYLSERLNAEAWASLEDEQKEKLLVRAFRVIQSYVTESKVPFDFLVEAQAEQAIYELRFAPDSFADALSNVSIDGVKAEFQSGKVARMSPETILLLKLYRRLPNVSIER